MKFTNQLKAQGRGIRNKPINRATFEQECIEKINSNLRSIAQFRENAGHIGPILKARFDKQVASLEHKNEMLRQDLLEFKASGECNNTQENESEKSNTHTKELV